jgi:hypothetical protein
MLTTHSAPCAAYRCVPNPPPPPSRAGSRAAAQPARRQVRASATLPRALRRRGRLLPELCLLPEQREAQARRGRQAGPDQESTLGSKSGLGLGCAVAAPRVASPGGRAHLRPRLPLVACTWYDKPGVGPLYPPPLLRPIYAYASSTRSGGNLVTEVEGLQLYLSKHSATGVCGRESHPHPGTLPSHIT